MYVTYSSVHQSQLWFSLRFCFGLAPSAAIIIFCASRYDPLLFRWLRARSVVAMGEASYSMTSCTRSCSSWSQLSRLELSRDLLRYPVSRRALHLRYPDDPAVFVGAASSFWRSHLGAGCGVYGAVRCRGAAPPCPSSPLRSRWRSRSPRPASSSRRNRRSDFTS